ncbi:MAG: AMP-dependent synthetase, partial [Methanobacteriota archaeon]
MRDGPGPAWMPSKAGVRASNIGKLMAARRFGSFEDLQRWSIDRREEFWATMIRKLGIVFRKKPSGILKQPLDPRHPEWLPGARMNIAESCFRAGANKTAILFGLEGS